LSKWEERLRNALKQGGLGPCGDVNVNNCPVLDKPSNINQYDVILTSLCLEDACLTHDVYKATVKRLSALLKPGGFIFMTHGRNQSFYNVIDKRFFALAINEQQMREAFEHAGLVDIHVTGVEKPRDNYADADGFLIGYAFKQ
jgi:methylase of polypeptide subunit release factors